MSMVTRCPNCATTFRVVPQQLQAQHGMVRCGRCATVFDGFKTLATLRDAAPIDAREATATAQPVASSPAPVSVLAEAVSAGPDDTPALSAGEPIPPLELSTPEIAVPAPVSPSIAPVEDVYIEEPRPPARSRGWAIGALLLMMALAAQALYFYRSEIAANLPEARPFLVQMCEQLRCTVALPQRPRSISIEASDMQATDPSSPGVIALTATLRNHATTALGYPALDVVLTNSREHTVARRVFFPSEYLDAGKDARAGIPPNAEVTLRLVIDSGDLGAQGFRLDLLAAPAR